MAESYYGTGRRKTSVAKVRLVPGEGNITVNSKPLDHYFRAKTYEILVKEPLQITEAANKFDVIVAVRGGGMTGQADAIKLGIARALIAAEPNCRATLHKAGLLTRDPRMKERKKYGLKSARKRPQYSKR